MGSFLRDIMLGGGVKSVFDLGAGKGFNSLFCASFGANVTAVDKKEFPEYLKNHPKIKLVNEKIEDFSWTETKYDLVLLNNILPFLAKDFLKEKLVPSVIKNLNINGSIYISTFSPDDPIFSKDSKASLYTLNELIDIFSSFSVVAQKEEVINDNHYPLGLHEHNTIKIVLRKK